MRRKYIVLHILLYCNMEIHYIYLQIHTRHLNIQKALLLRPHKLLLELHYVHYVIIEYKLQDQSSWRQCSWSLTVVFVLTKFFF
eukprot:UN08091